MNRVAFAVALCVAVSSCLGADECRQVIKLGFGSVRCGLASNTTEFPASVGNPCRREAIEVFCSDTDYPNDIFCDIGGLKSHYEWGDDSRPISVELMYSHPTAEGITCSVKFTPEGRNFQFSQGHCWPSSVDDQTVPHFRVSKIIRMNIIARTSNLAQRDCRCDATATFTFTDAKNPGVLEGNAGVSRGRVKFNFEVLECCRGSVLIIGRGEEHTYFKNDGRRYRPHGK